MDGRMISPDTKTPFYAYRLTGTYRISRVIVEEPLSDGYFKLSTAGSVHGNELFQSAEDAIADGKQKILRLERGIANTQRKVNDRKAALKQAEKLIGG
jgi:hypothetical protein